MIQARRAFYEVYRRPAYTVAAVFSMLVAAALLAWGAQVIAVFPEGGLYLNTGPVTVFGLIAAAALLGLTVPLHVFGWRRASRAAAASQGVGVLGAIFGIGSLSCCAPLLLPGLLSLIGFSGSTLLALNLRLHQLRVPLTVLAIAFLLVSLWMALRNVAAVCRIAVHRPASGAGSGVPAA